MAKQGEYYSGRLIFDHFPKTAGQAINAWLVQELGRGTVSPPMIAWHKELLKLNGTFPVINAHIHYKDGEGLDPRFQYATLLREPVDRAVSWLHFVVNNHAPSQLPEIYEYVRRFLDSEGEDLHADLVIHLRNTAVFHFASIGGWRRVSDNERVERAFEAIGQYDCVGVYERLGEFVNSLAALIGIPAPASLRSVNVTAARPAIDKVSPKLRDSILALTELDRALYGRVSQLAAERYGANPPAPPKISAWQPYELSVPAPKCTDQLTLHSARALTGASVAAGAVLRFDLDFELHQPVEKLQVGLHVYDDQKRCAFGVNNLLLDQTFERLPAGRHRLVHSLTADFPTGDYTIGFAFADISGDLERNLFWEDETLRFQVARSPGSAGVGYAQAYAQMFLDRGAKVEVMSAEAFSEAA